MWKSLVLPAALFAAACSQPAQAPDAAPDQAAATLSGTGTVTAIDPATGAISLDHDAIAALNWPSMTMQFTVEDPALLQGIAVGDRVSFQLKSETESQSITALTKQ